MKNKDKKKNKKTNVTNQECVKSTYDVNDSHKEKPTSAFPKEIL